MSRLVDFDLSSSYSKSSKTAAAAADDGSKPSSSSFPKISPIKFKISKNQTFLNQFYKVFNISRPLHYFTFSKNNSHQQFLNPSLKSSFFVSNFRPSHEEDLCKHYRRKERPSPQDRANSKSVIQIKKQLNKLNWLAKNVKSGDFMCQKTELIHTILDSQRRIFVLLVLIDERLHVYNNL
jgi:hypothetical protein